MAADPKYTAKDTKAKLESASTQQTAVNNLPQPGMYFSAPLASPARPYVFSEPALEPDDPVSSIARSHSAKCDLFDQMISLKAPAKMFGDFAEIDQYLLPRGYKTNGRMHCKVTSFNTAPNGMGSYLLKHLPLEFYTSPLGFSEYEWVKGKAHVETDEYNPMQGREGPEIYNEYFKQAHGYGLSKDIHPGPNPKNFIDKIK